MTESRSRIQNIIIAGGGTAGWMTAAALSEGLKGLNVKITLIESEEIGTIGVGEATIPAMHAFHGLLGIDQAEFMRECNATFKLGIEFIDWGQLNQSYIHPFCTYGRDNFNIAFHQMWFRYAAAKRARGEDCNIEDYNMCCVAARKERFAHPISGKDVGVAPLGYAFHLDAGLYAKFLRKYSELRGVTRIEGKISGALRNAESGDIERILMEDGRSFTGDFFVDCSGMRSLLLGQVLDIGFNDWRNWLPCDRAVAVQCAKIKEPIPYTRATADAAGWRWRIALQNRTGNGYVYASPFISDDEARARLMETLDGQVLTEPRFIKFLPGHRKKFWVGNCVAIGLSAGFLEPLESTAIYLIQAGILKFLALFPTCQGNSREIDNFNEMSEREYLDIRDFLMLHYKATIRDDTPFWRHCRDLEAPETLINRMELFSGHGRMFISQDNLFTPPSWLAVMVGQGLIPREYDPLADRISDQELHEYMDHVRNTIVRNVNAMPGHGDYIQRFCAVKAAS